MKQIPAALFAIFQAEHAEHLEQIRSILALAEKLGGDGGQARLEEAFRRAHSLKGAARAVNLPQVEGLAHHLESLFARVRDGSLELDPEATKVIHQVLDANEDCLAALGENRTPDPEGAALRAIQELLERPSRTGAGNAPALSAPEAVTPEFRAVEMVRLPAEDLDRMVRSTSRVVAESRRQQAVTEDLLALSRHIAELEAEWGRFSKSCTASLLGLTHKPKFSTWSGQAASMQRQVHSLVSLARTARLRQSRHAWTLHGSTEQLQRDVWNARMAPADDLFQSFRKMVRELARDENKEIQFQLSGSAVRADRMVLQSLKDPVMHLLRNAISHGLEPPRERERKGKAAAGRLTLRLGSQRGRLSVEVDDDGRGVDFDKVAEVAAKRGLMPADGHAPAPQELAQMLFRPGFSTSDTVGDLSGRGMGLSVVYETVRRLQGEVEVRPKAGPGASIVLTVPLSVSTLHLLLVGCEGQTFGIPTHGVERVCRVSLAQIEKVEGQPMVNIGGRALGLFSLARLLHLGDGKSSFDGDLLPVMVLRSGTRAVALLVDQFVGEKEALLQSLGMPGLAHGAVSGGAILGEGSVAVVLNAASLVQNCTPESGGPALRIARPVPLSAPRILVVDDSITTRTLEKSILEAHGYRVQVAIDGVEALQLLRHAPVDLIITDIQMPRLDGFGLLEAVKADPLLGSIPVIIVSSLERAEDQRRGLQLGADAYVMKGLFDQGELLEAIRQIL